MDTMFGLYDTLTQDVTANKSKGLDVQLHEGITNDFLASHIEVQSVKSRHQHFRFLEKKLSLSRL